MCLKDQEITMMHTDGPNLHVYINCLYNGRMQDVLNSTGKQVEYPHTNAEISAVLISTAGMETRRVRIVKLLLELSDGVLRAVLSRYGEVRDIQAETWSRLYR